MMEAADKENTPKTYQVPWIEKYRPKTLEDVVGNEETLVRLQAIAKDGNLPNLILCGPPGTGKASLKMCIRACFYCIVLYCIVLYFIDCILIHHLSYYNYLLTSLLDTESRHLVSMLWPVNCWAPPIKTACWN